jgi:hypothetical protein
MVMPVRGLSVITQIFHLTLEPGGFLLPSDSYVERTPPPAFAALVAPRGRADPIEWNQFSFFRHAHSFPQADSGC